jgi:hypothetical protein
MRKLGGLVLAGALLLSVSSAQAAEVANMLTNNLFATAISNDADTGTTTAVFVTREKGKGAPRDSITVFVSGPNGFSVISGSLPKNALQINKKSASVDVAVSDIVVTFQDGDIPPDGVVSVDWEATDVTRTTGNEVLEFGTTRVHIHGHRTSATAVIEGSVFGADMVAPTGDISTVHDIVQIHVSN